MTLDEVLHWCIFRSPSRTAKSAAESLGIHPTQFGTWRNHAKSGNYPTDEMCEKIALLCDLNPYTVWLAVQAEKVKAKKIKAVLMQKITPAHTAPLKSTPAQ